MNRSIALLASLPLLTAAAVAQSPAKGLRLYAPFGSLETHLVDTNDNVVHTWRGTHTPVGAYLEDDGMLLRPFLTPYIPNVPRAGGASGGISRQKFSGGLTWEWIYADDNNWLHHDVATMPNGNVLAIAWERMTPADAIAAGRNPALLSYHEWLPDKVIEVQQTGPTTGAIVWEWRFMDHVIQDFDPTKPNYGVVADHPELLDINFPAVADPNGEWNHCNTIDYDPVNDLIVLGSPFQNEFWIIDHSTTTAEAAGHTGGNYGRGGDILYRWGNPQAYRAGTPADQQLFFHHGAYFIEEGLPGAGNILIFNNRAGAFESSIVEVVLPTSFTQPAPGVAWGPAAPVWEYRHPLPGHFYSEIVSNAIRLPNGNTLACSGRQSGALFEVDPAGNVVWELKPENVPSIPGLTFRVDYTERMMWSDDTDISVSRGGEVKYWFLPGTVDTGKSYFMFGSASGTNPGVVFDGELLELNPDNYFMTTISSANQLPFRSTAGSISGDGMAVGGFMVPPGLLPSALAGSSVHHGFVIFDQSQNAVTSASAVLPMNFVP